MKTSILTTFILSVIASLCCGFILALFLFNPDKVKTILALIMTVGEILLVISGVMATAKADYDLEEFKQLHKLESLGDCTPQELDPEDLDLL